MSAAAPICAGSGRGVMTHSDVIKESLGCLDRYRGQIPAPNS